MRLSKRILYGLWVTVSFIVLGVFAVKFLLEQGTASYGIVKLEEEISPKVFMNYAVNSKGEIAVATSLSPVRPQYILIYDAQGNYLYGYSVFTDGSVVVDWDETDHVQILYAREDVVRTLREDGSVLEEEELDASEFSSRYGTLLKGTKRVGDITYHQNRGKYKITAIGQGSEEVQLYVATKDRIKGLLYVILIVAASIAPIFLILRTRFWAKRR